MNDHFERQNPSRDSVLLAETLHRMKNLLGIVRAMAIQTETAGRSAEQYRDVFLGRLETVVAAQQFLLADSSGTYLEDLIPQVLKLADPSRVILGVSPSVRLENSQIQPIAMMINELATNAIKYGALSNDNGVIQIQWDELIKPSGRKLQITWKEEAGPPVAQPEYQGFGTRMIDYNCAAQSGIASFDFASSGLKVILELPIA